MNRIASLLKDPYILLSLFNAIEKNVFQRKFSILVWLMWGLSDEPKCVKLHKAPFVSSTLSLMFSAQFSNSFQDFVSKYKTKGSFSLTHVSISYE